LKNKLPKCDGRPQLWTNYEENNLWIVYPSGEAEFYNGEDTLSPAGWLASGFSDISQKAVCEELVYFGYKFMEYL
jgi:hypothetical protein